MTTAVITMGGIGKRFLDAGYHIPKYFIDVNGKSLFRWAMESLQSYIDAGSPFVFVVKKSDDAALFIQTECAAIGIKKSVVVELDVQTDGQATTALFAGKYLDEDVPFFVYNIDTHITPGIVPCFSNNADGWIPCFPGVGSGWSFVSINENGHAVEVREKVRISDHATLGLYWFSSFRLYKETYKAYYGNVAGKTVKEKYIAPMYNQLIQSGLTVKISTIHLAHVIPMGTPEEVAAFVE